MFLGYRAKHLKDFTSWRHSEQPFALPTAFSTSVVDESGDSDFPVRIFKLKQ